FVFSCWRRAPPPHLPPSPTRRSSDLSRGRELRLLDVAGPHGGDLAASRLLRKADSAGFWTINRFVFNPDGRTLTAQIQGRPRRRSEEHTSELQSHLNLVCRLPLEKKK